MQPVRMSGLNRASPVFISVARTAQNVAYYVSHTHVAECHASHARFFSNLPPKHCIEFGHWACGASSHTRRSPAGQTSPGGVRWSMVEDKSRAAGTEAPRPVPLPRPDDYLVLLTHCLGAMGVSMFLPAGARTAHIGAPDHISRMLVVPCREEGPLLLGGLAR